MNEFRKKLSRNTAQFQEKGRRGILSFLFGRTAIVLILLAIQFFLLISLFMRWQFAAYAYGERKQNG